MPDTTLRQLKLLECIPRFPFKKTPQEIKEVLENEGFDISERRIQRDLIKLSNINEPSSPANNGLINLSG